MAYLPALPAAPPALAWLPALLLLRWVAGRGLVLLAVPVLVALATADHQLAGRLPPALAGQDVLLQGVVCDFPRTDARAVHFVLHAGAPWSGGEAAAIPVAWYDTAASPRPGERWQLLLRLRELRGFSNPGAADTERRQFVAGAVARAYVRPSRDNRRLAAGLACPTGRLRDWLAARLAEALGQRRAMPFLQALVVGARGGLSDADWELLRRTGTTHLMAISGLHIGLCAALGAWLGRRLAGAIRRAGRRAPGALCVGLAALLAATLYSALAGFSVPTLRALIMVGAAAVLAARRRGTSGWQLLGLAVYVLLLCQPLAVLAPGFWLSVLAVAGLLLGSLAVLPDRRPIRAGRLLAAQLRVTLVLLPLGLGFFGQFSAVSPLANLLVIPVFAVLVVPLALLGAVLVAGTDNAMPLVAAAWLLERCLDVLDLLQSLPGAFWPVPPRAGWALGAGLAGMFLLALPRPRLLAGLALGLAWPLVAGAPPAAAPAQLRVVVMDVGQGLAVLVQTPRHALLYDAGPRFGHTDAARLAVLPVLARFGIARLDRIVISHDDMDHAGGLASLRATQPGVPVMASGSLAGARPCVAGTVWIWEGVRFQFLHPSAGGPRWSDNDGSCVLRVATAGASILLPGDVSRRAESWLLRARQPLAADLVVAPHHGSSTSSSEGFVARTRPRFVVYATGFANRWGFPRPEVRARWRRAGACGLDTAMLGALEFTAAPGGTLRLAGRQRVDAAHPWTRGRQHPDLSACL